MTAILTLPEAAARLRCSVSTLRDWHRLYGFPVRRLSPRRSVVIEEELIAWVTSRPGGSGQRAPWRVALSNLAESLADHCAAHDAPVCGVLSDARALLAGVATQPEPCRHEEWREFVERVVPTLQRRANNPGNPDYRRHLIGLLRDARALLATTDDTQSPLGGRTAGRPADEPKP
jgi:hypothetical protein